MWSSHSIPRYLANRNKNLSVPPCPQIALNVYSSQIYKSQKCEITQTFINRSLVKLTVINPYNGIVLILSNKRERTTDTWKIMLTPNDADSFLYYILFTCFILLKIWWFFWGCSIDLWGSFHLSSICFIHLLHSI